MSRARASCKRRHDGERLPSKLTIGYRPNRMKPSAWLAALVAIAACGGRAAGPDLDEGFSCPEQGAQYHCLASALDAPCASPANGLTCPQGTQCYLSSDVSLGAPPGVTATAIGTTFCYVPGGGGVNQGIGCGDDTGQWFPAYGSDGGLPGAGCGAGATCCFDEGP
jgi:hypothetical protein